MLPSVARRGGAPIGVGDGGDLIGFGGEGVGAAVSGCFVDTAEGIRGLHEGFTEVLRAGATAAAEDLDVTTASRLLLPVLWH